MAGTSQPREGLEGVLASARLLVLDVDGTLTDGRVVYLGDQELAVFDVHDGQGLVWLRRAGITLAFVSGRGSPAVRRRAEELGVEEVHLRVGPKDEVLGAIQERRGIAPTETVSMGDDLADLALRARSALFVAPASARPEVRRLAGLVTAASGGRGAVRELAERLLDARGLWSRELDRAVQGAG